MNVFTSPRNMQIERLFKYKIFLLKIVQLTISLIIIIILPLIFSPPTGHMYCISTGPTLVMSLIFIELYVFKRVPLFMEKMYLFFQVLFTFGAFIQCLLLNLNRFFVFLLYGPFYFALCAVLALDLILIANERGCTINVA